MTIAVLLATHNRKDKTLACLSHLKNQEMPAGIELKVFLTDDASTDGTQEAVKEEFPEVHLYTGPGDLFWAGGMRNSWKQAMESKPNFYLLLNDDTFLLEDALPRFIESSQNYYQEYANAAICVGSTSDPESGEVTYGGNVLYSQKRPQHYLLEPGSTYRDCDMASANILLVPAKVVDTIGILSEEFTHGIADYDYSLRAKKAGFPIVILPGIYGSCQNDHGKNWKPSSASLRERLQYLYSVKGLAYQEYLTFIKRHFPANLPDAFLKLWVKTLFPIVYDLYKK